MKDKQRKIIAVFNVPWDLLLAFCGTWQGCDKQKGALLIPHFWSFHVFYPQKTEDLRMDLCPDVVILFYSIYASL